MIDQHLHDIFNLAQTEEQHLYAISDPKGCYLSFGRAFHVIYQKRSKVSLFVESADL